MESVATLAHLAAFNLLALVLAHPWLAGGFGAVFAAVLVRLVAVRRRSTPSSWRLSHLVQSRHLTSVMLVLLVVAMPTPSLLPVVRGATGLLGLLLAIKLLSLSLRRLRRVWRAALAANLPAITVCCVLLVLGSTGLAVSLRQGSRVSAEPAPATPESKPTVTAGRPHGRPQPPNQQQATAKGKQSKPKSTEPSTLQAFTTPATAIIANGTIQLGVNDTGDLIVPGGPPSSGGLTAVGLRYLPTNAEVLSPGCWCEGWGAADATSGITGSIDNYGVSDLAPVSFTATATSAVSVAQVGSTLRVTHDYHPSARTPNLYAVTVTIENISAAAVDARYRRTMDWDVAPTEFDEFVTVHKGASAAVLYDNNDGFAPANPLGPAFYANDVTTLVTGDFTDHGPDDQGALFDFGFGTLAPGASKTFTLYYGGAGNEQAALAILQALGIQTYSLAEADTVDGPTQGLPQTFIFGFSEEATEDTSQAPIASVSQTALGFGDQTVNLTSASQTITLSNSGNAPLPISSIDLGGANAGAFAQFTACGSSLAAGASCTISITFTPPVMADQTATLTIASSISIGIQPVFLRGTGVLYVRQFNNICSSHDASGNIGIAFDGTYLWYSCSHSTPDLYKIEPLTGNLIAVYSVAEGLGALAWDGNEKQLWLGWGGRAADDGIVRLFNPATGTVTRQLNVAPDQARGDLNIGLTYDAGSNSLYINDDNNPNTIGQYNASTGERVKTVVWKGANDPRCTPGGLAAGGALLYEGMRQGTDQCNQIFGVGKDDPGLFPLQRFEGSAEGLQNGGLECDNVTFSPKTALWVRKDQLSPEAIAIELPAGSCAAGGGVDSDGDGLLDDWEEHGVWIDPDGDGPLTMQFIDLPAMQADPQKADIFLQIDWMELHDPNDNNRILHSHKLSPAAIRTVVEAFRSSPYRAPGTGIIGINLHVDEGPDSILDFTNNVTWGERGLARGHALEHHVDSLGTKNADGTYNWSEFDTLKSANFTPRGRTPIFHYVIAAHTYANERSSGISRGIPGSDLLITLTNANDNELAGTLMHELGHNLRLQHGGGDSVNYKPNYLSVMNYAFQFTDLTRRDPLTGQITDQNFDYSRQQLGDLVESQLDEGTGLGVAANDYGSIYYCNGQAQFINIVNAANRPVDWNCQNGIEVGTVAADINCGDRNQAPGDCDGGHQRLTGFDDWAHLALIGGAIGQAGFTPSLPASTPLEEPLLPPTQTSLALTFNGINQDVEVPDSPDLHITTNLTLEAWIKPSASPPDHRHIVGKNTYELAIEPDSGTYHAVFDFSSGDGSYHTITSGPLALNQWAHVAGTYDGSTMRLFVNGTLVASETVSGSIDQTTNPLRIGSADANADYFPGTIDEVRLSNIVRYTATFATPAAPFSVDANTVGLWHLDEGSGTTTADATGHGHNGTLVNGPTWTTDTPFTTPRLLVGSQLVPAYLDTNDAGIAEAFQYTATATGAATALTVYLDSTSTATQVVVGLYSNAAGDVPGTLLAQTTLTSPVAGAWNTVTLPSAAITAGTQYWIAVLGPVGAGTVQFRDTPTEAGGNKSQTSAQSNLTTLPATWTPGTSYINSPLAAYATEAP